MRRTKIKIESIRERRVENEEVRGERKRLKHRRTKLPEEKGVQGDGGVGGGDASRNTHGLGLAMKGRH